MALRNIQPLNDNITEHITVVPPHDVPVAGAPIDKSAFVDLPPIPTAPVPSYLDEETLRREQAEDLAAIERIKQRTQRRISITAVAVIIFGALSTLPAIISHQPNTIVTGFLGCLIILAGVGLMKRKLFSIKIIKALLLLHLIALLFFFVVSVWVGLVSQGAGTVSFVSVTTFIVPIAFLFVIYSVNEDQHTRAALD